MMNSQKRNKRSTRGKYRKNREHETKSEQKTSLWNVVADAPEHNSMPYITEKFTESNIDLVTEQDGDRHMFVCRSRNVRLSSLGQSCVGSIVTIDGKTLNLISHMQPSPIKLVENDLPRIFRTFKDFECLPVNDGTRIGLYWYNNKWVIRSLNGYDVGNFTWNGAPTYSEILNDVIQAYPDFDLDKLNKTKCYTIGIKNTKFHPFLEGTKENIIRAWFVQSVDVGKVNEQIGSFEGAVSYSDDIGLPLQHPIVGMSIRDIMIKAKVAYDTYVTSGEVFYGVILRSNSESIIIQSSLYEHIASVFYINTMNNTIKTCEYNRQKYMVLHNFLYADSANYERFRRLFPQYDTRLDKFKQIVTEIVDSMVELIEKGKTRTSPIPSDEEPVPRDPRQQIFDSVVKSMLRELSKKAGGFPKLDMNITKMLRKFVYNVSFITILHDLMYYEIKE
jgi:hypothetical protein